MIIIFDTETTGLAKSNDSPVRIQPRIIELYAVKVFPDSPSTVKEELHLFFDPEKPRAEWPVIKDLGENGSMISEEMLADAPTFAESLVKVQDFWLGATVTVAHNLSFDLNMLYAELKRVDAVTRFPWTPRCICTVEQSEQIRGNRMSLMDLHMHLFGEGFEEAHLASKDTQALHRCFCKMVEQGMISPRSLRWGE